MSKDTEQIGPQQQAGYDAVYAYVRELEKDDVYLNAYIWRAVEAFFNAYEAKRAEPVDQHDPECVGCSECDEALVDLDPMEKYLSRAVRREEAERG